jgi:hypothetical protein
MAECFSAVRSRDDLRPPFDPSQHRAVTPPFAFGLAAGVLMLVASAIALLSAQDVDDLKSGIVKIRAQEGGTGRVGTGFIVRIQDDTVHIVTAAHVVEGDAHPDVAFFPRANEYFQSDILGIEGGDPRGVAALVVKGPRLPSGLRAFTVSSNVNVRGGESIRVIGFPGEFATPWLVIEGSIGGRRGSDISFSAVLGEGSSGGPLLLNGNVIGIISQMGSKVGYAVPITSARFALEGWGIEFTEGGDALLPKVITDKDGGVMTLVPRGEFPMSGDPPQYVFLDAYYIDKEPAAEPVPWVKAAESCTARGKRLPTEAEWEKATKVQAITAITPTKPELLPRQTDERLRLDAKQWEWVADWYQPDYWRIRPSRNPTGPSTGVSNESALARYDAETRIGAEENAARNCTDGRGRSRCSDEQRLDYVQSYYRMRLRSRPSLDMEKVNRQVESRGGALSRGDHPLLHYFIYRCVREP